jgi:hypothetical protein
VRLNPPHTFPTVGPGQPRNTGRGFSVCGSLIARVRLEARSHAIPALQLKRGAQCRLPDEYDAAQERGEIAKQGQIGRGNRSFTTEHLSKTEDMGLPPHLKDQINHIGA